MNKLVLTLFIFLAFCFFLPQIISTGWGKRQVESYLHGQLGGEISIEKLSLSWFNEQSCHNVHWIEDSKKLDCHAQHILCKASLFDCLFHHEKPIHITIDDGQIESPTKMGVLKKKKPLNLHIEHVNAILQSGIVSFEKTPIQFTEKLTFQMEGAVDLNHNHLDVMLGIPSTTLKKMFKIKELPEGYILEVPVSCEMSPSALEKKLVGIFLKNYATVTSLQR